MNGKEMSMDFQNYFSTSGINGKVQKAIARETAQALRSFCEQEPEFAQAIEQSGRGFQECLDSIAKGVTTAISDFDVYSKAAAFYFPGAKVHFRMELDLTGDADKPETPAPAKPTLSMNFDSLLDF
jgi:hypothetical protein